MKFTITDPDGDEVSVEPDGDQVMVTIQLTNGESLAVSLTIEQTNDLQSALSQAKGRAEKRVK